jgi:hypothetical protein
MPLGLNRTDLNSSGTSYKNGTPVTTPHNFGNPVTEPVDFGNDIPSDGKEQNKVTWVPSPAHFGNIIGGSGGASGFELESGAGVILLENGSILLLEIQ